MKNPEVQHEQEDDQRREGQPKPNHLALLAQKRRACPTNRMPAVRQRDMSLETPPGITISRELH
jgi:hypothetical protein